MKIKLGLILVLFSTSLQVGDTIIWSKEKNLTWKDFQGKVPAQDPHVSLSRVEIRYESQVDKQGKMTMNIESVFIKNLSWVKQDRKSDHILRHEQYHFNITEVWARKLRKEIVSKKWNTKTFEKEFNTLFKKMMAQTLKEQKRYDDETNHSKVFAKQSEWERDIDTELSNLKDYNSITVPFLFE